MPYFWMPGFDGFGFGIGLDGKTTTLESVGTQAAWSSEQHFPRGGTKMMSDVHLYGKK